MTRGKIIYINNDSQVFATCEFNGDMHPQRYGEDVLAGFKNGLFQGYEGYERFVESFNRKYFGYDEELIKKFVGCPEQTFDITDENGQDIDIHTPELLYDFFSNNGVICQKEV